ncbi:MAG: SPASM domain-containing protein [Atopobiaceae bacterium]|nr:SPASM domain-containing protein [Atopobiaceae bacterium]
MDEVSFVRERIRERVFDLARARDPLPLMLTVCPTARCNFACPYCFQEPDSADMAIETQDALKRFVEKRLAAGSFNEIRVDWFGGEPLLVPDIVERLSGELLALADRFGISYKALVHTNGYLFTQESADMLERCRVTKVIVTVDGDRAAHDATRHLKNGGPTYDRIMGNLEALHTGMTVHVRCNVHAGNIGCLDALRDRVEAMAARNGTAMRVVPAAVRANLVAAERGDTTSLIDAESFARVLRDFGEVERRQAFTAADGVCPIVRLNELYVDARGEIYPSCHTIAGNDAYVLGSVLSENPIDWDAAAQKLADEFAFPDDQPECLTCKLLPCCYGGCPWTRRSMGDARCPEILADPDTYVLSLLGQQGDCCSK